MSALSADTVAARQGRPLTDVVTAHDEAPWKPIELTVAQRHELIDVWRTMFDDVYVHYTQKRALYGYDPTRALLALRRQIPYLNSAEFLRELTLLINRLRDQHTQMYLSAADHSLTSYVAALPFLVEVCGAYLSPTYIVTKLSDDVQDPDFVVGVRLTTWNGVPFARAVDLYADTLTGGRPDSRRARALETLTQRPLEFLPPPDELWVDIGYRHADDPPDHPARTVRFEWRAIEPAKAITAEDLIEVRTRRAIDATSETARRARKLLFQPELWEHDQTGNRPTAKAGGWIQSSFSDAVSARRITTSQGTFGYLRLWTFDVDHTNQYVDAIADLLRQLPRKGLIIDLRSNPGGVIDTAEQLLQLFTSTPIEPIRFALRATAAMVDIAEADGNGADLADWSSSTRAALDLGEEFSQHLPISDPDACNRRRRVYRGPIVAVVNANTFSCGDLFAAGIVDHGIGQIVSIGDATGAGGANVWTNDDIEYAYHAARRTLPRIPAGISFSIAIRRMTRTGFSAGLAVEDVGVTGHEKYDMTENDLLNGNTDLSEFCTRLLATT
jgi:Peptidase family S41